MQFLNEKGSGMEMKKRINAIRVMLFALSAIMITYGVYRDEVVVVFNKAINICLECIGIG